jgi:radical SAM-linked protein
MAPEPPLTSTSPPKLEAAPRFKYRVRFRKADDLRLVSHHDLMHVFERMFRRADLLLPVTQGFNPRAKFSFALSLALGVAGLNEILEFELTHDLTVAEVQRRLTSQCPPGLVILSVRSIDFRQSAFVRRARYALPLPETHADLAERCQALLARDECWMVRTRPHPKRINIRPFISELQMHGDRLEMALWITPNGAARPEEIVDALGLHDWLESGAVIERVDLEVVDELPPDAVEMPVIPYSFADIRDTDRVAITPEAARPTAIISNPLSFET